MNLHGKMESARYIDMDSRKKLASECHELRTQLKQWEKSFAETNSGRKPGKDDIKKNPEIAAKYRKYNHARDVLEGKKNLEALNVRSPSVRVHNSSLKVAQRGHSQTPRKILFATPRKAQHSLPDSHPSKLDPYDAPATSVSPHPYVFKNAIGPTPQRDGNILGLFDLLSNPGSTPSTRKRKADELVDKQTRNEVAQTPSRKPLKANADLLDHLGDVSEGRRHSRTPASDGKKFFLNQFFATPGTLRYTTIPEEGPNNAIEKTGVNQTPLRTRVLGGRKDDDIEKEGGLENTPAFLRRTTSFKQRLLKATGSTLQQSASDNVVEFASPTTVRRGPKMRAFKGRALSEIMRGLRQMEDDDDEDEMDALREIEGNAMNSMGSDDQAADDAPVVEGGTARTWKKKGQKRTTRRVIMRPTSTQPKPRRAESEEVEPSAVEEVVKVEETQQVLTEHEATEGDLQPLLYPTNDKENNNPNNPSSHSDNDFINPDSSADTDADELASTPPPKKQKILHSIHLEKLPSTKRRSKAVEEPLAKEKPDKTKKKKGINPNATSHMNFRSLKIRNRNSKAKGRFGRRR